MSNIKSLKHASPTLGPPVRFMWPAQFPYTGWSKSLCASVNYNTIVRCTETFWLPWSWRILAVTQLDKLFDGMLYFPRNFMLFDW